MTEVLESFGYRVQAPAVHVPTAVGGIARWLDGGLQGVGLYQQKIHVLGEMDQTIACSIAKAERELGYAPRFALREGMTASVEWCLANGQQI